MHASFPQQFEAYLTHARAAREKGSHHDQRRQIFLDFLDEAFGVKSSEIEIEQYIQIKGQQVPMKGTARIRKGWIDAVFQDLIFEFKKDLKREEADGLRELLDYLTTIPNGEACVGLLTDGFQFVAYVLDATQADGLRATDRIDLEKVTPDVAFLWLDAYLFSQKQQVPTAADIVRRFGLTSPTFAAASRVLRTALDIFAQSEAGALAVKRQQWAFYLARVYGSADASNDEMFIRHTYLCQFAKVLAFAAQSSAAGAAGEIGAIVAGTAFERLGVNNIGEQDFFAWVLAPEVRDRTLPALAQIAASLAVYDLARIDEDLLKQLYQNLVEAETRHELGEFYTPDWLADRTLQEIGYHTGQSLLDPACGSGTFLFTAIRQLVRQGLTGGALVDFALEHIMGMDVHPLAVTIAKVNYMLAILPHLRGLGRSRGARAIPIYMANALQLTTSAHRVRIIEVPIDATLAFAVPVAAASSPPDLREVLQRMGTVAADARQNFANFGAYALSKFPPDAASGMLVPPEASIWNTNVRYLAELIRAGRDTIWVYVLQNVTGPQVLQHRKFDVVVGNPPWLSYRYIQDASYQADVKKLAQEYGLVASSDRKLTTQIELSTIFFAHAATVYLRTGGTLAFVMPRSVITGAKQHQGFQKFGFTKLLDLKDVSPLFNVETCVLVRQRDQLHTADLPTTRLAGRLPAHECSLAVARAHLIEQATTTTFAHMDAIASPYYYPRFKQGATLVPRNLVFVTSAQPNLSAGELANNAIMMTDPDVDAEAKVPWKGMRHKGYIDDDFLYATLLSKNLLPFGVRKLHLVALPMRVKDGHFARCHARHHHAAP